MSAALPADLAAAIEQAWDVRDQVTADSSAVHNSVNLVLDLLDCGAERVAEPDGSGGWRVNQWLKKAVLLSFRLNDNAVMDYGSAGAPSFDKVPLKFTGWDADGFRAAGIRAVPGAIVRRGAHIGKNVVLMPSFVNIGANVGDGTMIDTWASVGSCAQVGQNCHISAGAGIGGVLEPMQANPTIIGDNCFIGARSEIVEGVIVGEGCVVAMGVFITATSKIIYRDTGKVITGHIPPFSVVVPGAMTGKVLSDGSPGPSLGCAVIIKSVDAAP
jgi:2,3,4,5-tetrahydropyridine-2-carboxylate N-succinyltransferase